VYSGNNLWVAGVTPSVVLNEEDQNNIKCYIADGVDLVRMVWLVHRDKTGAELSYGEVVYAVDGSLMKESYITGSDIVPAGYFEAGTHQFVIFVLSSQGGIVDKSTLTIDLLGYNNTTKSRSSVQLYLIEPAALDWKLRIVDYIGDEANLVYDGDYSTSVLLNGVVIQGGYNASMDNYNVDNGILIPRYIEQHMQRLYYGNCTVRYFDFEKAYPNYDVRAYHWENGEVKLVNIDGTSNGDYTMSNLGSINTSSIIQAATLNLTEPVDDSKIQTQAGDLGAQGLKVKMKYVNMVHGYDVDAPAYTYTVDITSSDQILVRLSQDNPKPFI